MKTLLPILFSFLLLYNCGTRAGNKNIPEYDYLIVIEYANKYNGDRLIKSTVMVMEYVKGSVHPTQTSQNEYFYTYDADKLVREDKYDIEQNNNSILRNSTIYKDRMEECIEWKGRDTVNYQLWEYNSDEKLVHIIKRVNFSAPAYDFVVSDNFENWLTYNADGSLNERIVKDLVTSKVSTINYFYNKKPTKIPNVELTIIYFDEKKIGDTLITKRFENGILTDIYRTYQDGESKLDLTFTSDNDLSLSIETIERNNEKIVITIDPEFESIDSLFYQNNKEVKNITTYPDFKSTTLTEYDSKGNISKEMRYTKQY